MDQSAPVAGEREEGGHVSTIRFHTGVFGWGGKDA